jgi:hypothetical protein
MVVAVRHDVYIKGHGDRWGVMGINDDIGLI